MGYCMTQKNVDFLMSEDKLPEALVAVKGLAASTKEFSWVNDEQVLRVETLEEALVEWGWRLDITDDGDVESICFEREKSGDELELFKAIAPFVEVNSFIEMLGEDGYLWRYHFNGKTCIEIEPEIDWDIKQKCFNYCPKCNATVSEIEWVGKEWSKTGETTYQNAICQKCGCEFREVHEYSQTEIKN